MFGWLQEDRAGMDMGMKLGEMWVDGKKLARERPEAAQQNGE